MLNIHYGIKTPDYIINNEKIDLKQIVGNGKYVIQGNIKNKQKQANNFVVDITESKIKEKDATDQIHNIYNSMHYLWIDKILLLRGKKILKIYKRSQL